MDKIKEWIKDILECLPVLIITAGVMYLLMTFVIVNAVVPTGSMKHTIEPGDRIFGNRLAYMNNDPERFDIIIFRMPDDNETIYIKRVIGLPGETVSVVDGKVYINDSEEPLDDSFIAEPMKGSFGPYVVPEDSYFMMGDNRNNSFDSRKWKNHFVPKENIIGKAGICYWPLSSIGIVK